jgi:Uma2 family endonuclease
MGATQPMRNLTPTAQTSPHDVIVVQGVTESDYMAQYAGEFYEWVQGDAVKMSPVSGRHDDISGYLRELFRAYFYLRPMGKVRSAPFVMRLEDVGTRREPDLQILVGDSLQRLTDTYTDGPANIAIEIVSVGTAKTDYGDKLEEYERGGVTEYWIIDPIRQETIFRRLSDNLLYSTVLPIDSGHYQTPLLPDFRLHVPTLWADELPGLGDVLSGVQEMLDQDKSE